MSRDKYPQEPADLWILVSPPLFCVPTPPLNSFAVSLPQNNLKELHGFETHAKDLFEKPVPVQRVDIRLAAESVKLEVRFRQILQQLDGEKLNQVFDPVTFSEQLVKQTTEHLGIPSPPRAKKGRHLLH